MRLIVDTLEPNVAAKFRAAGWTEFYLLQGSSVHLYWDVNKQGWPKDPYPEEERNA